MACRNDHVIVIEIVIEGSSVEELPVVRYDAGETFDEGLDLPQRTLLLFPLE